MSRRSSQLFASPDVQIENVRQWSKKRGWGITAFDLAQLGDPPPKPRRELGAVVLVPSLPTMRKTFDSLSSIVESNCHGFMRARVHTSSHPSNLRLLRGIEHKPGLRWARLDLGAARGWAPIYSRDPRWSPHAEVLAAAAHFPNWVEGMNGKDIPYVHLTGYEHRYQSQTWTWTISITRIALRGLNKDREPQRPGMLTHEFVGEGDERYANPEIVGRNSIWDKELLFQRYRKEHMPDSA